jgi:hypothetical protein
MQLPFSGKQLGMLPLLLEVQDKGASPLEGNPCKVLDVRLRPEIGGLLPPEAGGWSVRLWMDAQNKPVRAGVRFPKGSVVIRVDKLDFSKELPASQWTPVSGAKQVSPEDFEKAAARMLQGGR